MRVLLNLLARLTPGLTTNELVVIERYLERRRAVSD